MVSKQTNKQLVQVLCKQKTIYGEAGEVGYIPESMVEAWVAKGRVEYIVAPKPKKPKKTKKEKQLLEEPVVQEPESTASKKIGESSDDKDNEEG